MLGPTPPRRILVPVHASTSARAALARARALADATDVRLRLLSVEPLPALSAIDWARPETWRRGRPRSPILEAGWASGDRDELVRRQGSLLTTILKEAARDDVHFVVMGCSARSRLSRGLAAPLHERVIREAKVPVMVVGADELDESASRDHGIERPLGPDTPRFAVLEGGRARSVPGEAPAPARKS